MDRNCSECSHNCSVFLNTTTTTLTNTSNSGPGLTKSQSVKAPSLIWYQIISVVTHPQPPGKKHETCSEWPEWNRIYGQMNSLPQCSHIPPLFWIFMVPISKLFSHFHLLFINNRDYNKLIKCDKRKVLGTSTILSFLCISNMFFYPHQNNTMGYTVRISNCWETVRGRKWTWGKI